MSVRPAPQALQWDQTERFVLRPGLAVRQAGHARRLRQPRIINRQTVHRDTVGKAFRTAPALFLRKAVTGTTIPTARQMRNLRASAVVQRQDVPMQTAGLTTATARNHPSLEAIRTVRVRFIRSVMGTAMEGMTRAATIVINNPFV